MEDQTLRVLVQAHHPRVRYTMQTVFSDIIGLNLELVTDGEHHISYLMAPADPEINLACDGFLYQDSLTADKQSNDRLSRIFRELAQVDAYVHPKLDNHGRHVERRPGLELNGIIAELRLWLKRNCPALHIPEPRFSWEITIDIDQPWKHQEKPWGIRMGSLLKSAVKADFGTVMEHFSGRDPFDTLDMVKEICPAERTKVFFLCDRHHPNDSRFTLRSAAYQDYVRRWKDAGFRIGLHPSYMSSAQAGLFETEKALLEDVIGPVVISRQHYLRYCLPDTFRTLEKLGFTEDYSLCGHEGLGGRTGIAYPYRWYDLKEERISNLRLVPAVVMDRTLQQYMQSNPAAAFGQTCAVIDTLVQTGGHFVIILHNETFSESGEWRGWLRWIKSVVAYLNQHGSEPR